jgi:hypothetical protein
MLYQRQYRAVAERPPANEISVSPCVWSLPRIAALLLETLWRMVTAKS